MPALVDPRDYQEAPAIRGEWVRGSAVDLSTDPRLIILEHWATWCEPCIAELPHLTKLQAKYPALIRVIAISDEPAHVVRRFVAAHDAVMRYDVVADGAQTWTSYQALDGVVGIPHACITRDQRVMWLGHPAALDGVLDMLFGGAWTPQLADSSRHLSKFLDTYLGHVRADRREQVADLALAFFEESLVDPRTQSGIAWVLLTESPAPHSNSDLALKLAERAAARTQRSDWVILGTLALALQADGQLERASATQLEAMALCHTSEAAKNCNKYERMLEKLLNLL